MKTSKYIWFILFLFLFSCKEKPIETEEPVVRDLEQIIAGGELVVLTSPGATSYFTFRGKKMGYQYDLAKRFASSLNLKMRLKVVHDENQLSEMLLNGEGDLIAYHLPVTSEMKRHFSFVDKTSVTNQVLVQPAGKSKITSVVDLIGKEVYVLAGTKYEQRLRNLNDEIGGGIIIIPIPDTVGIDALIDRVSLKRIPFTVADKDIALLNKTYLKNIDCSVDISFPQFSGWAVRQSSPELLAKLNEWVDAKKNTSFFHSTYYKYFKKNEYFSDKKIALLENGSISPYDDLFKIYAKEISWDWRLLAAMAYHESTFDTASVSPKGAVGLMQLLPQTADMTEEELMNPEENLKAAVKYIKELDRIFKRVEDNNERAKFIIASYNAGQGHVIDAMELSEKYEKERYIWDDNVDVYMRLKQDSMYYNDPVCKNGICRGEDVSDYVKDVLTRHQRYINTGAK